MADNPMQFSMLQEVLCNRYDSLSKRLKQVARYVLDHPDNIAVDTLATIAEHAEVPPSTLIRFANAFGFSGFNEMKQIYRQRMLEGTTSYSERIRLFRQSAQDGEAHPETPAEILNLFTMVNTQALHGLSARIDPSSLEQAIITLQGAKNIYVIGLRRSFSVASYLTYALRHADRRVYLIDGLGGMFAEQLSMVTDQDVVISISFTPYAQETVELVGLSVKSGAKQIVMTDSQVSPLAAFSDICFVVREAQVDGFRSQVASMCLAQTLAVALALDNARQDNSH